MKKKKIILFLLLISSLLSIYPIYNCIETKIVHEKNPAAKVGCMLTKLTYYP